MDGTVAVSQLPPPAYTQSAASHLTSGRCSMQGINCPLLQQGSPADEQQTLQKATSTGFAIIIKWIRPLLSAK